MLKLCRRLNQVSSRPLLLLALGLALAGCATRHLRDVSERPFAFGRDTFSYRNDLVWEYVFDDATGRDDLEFSVEGTARLSVGGDDAWLTVRGRVSGKYIRKQGADGETYFELDTTVATKLGNYVILAAAPSSTASGDAVALVVRLTAE